jgi:hypothetical protein
MSPRNDPLLPPPSVVHERLTANQRERRMLRTLLKLIYHEDRDVRERSQAEMAQRSTKVHVNCG